MPKFLIVSIREYEDSEEGCKTKEITDTSEQIEFDRMHFTIGANAGGWRCVKPIADLDDDRDPTSVKGKFDDKPKCIIDKSNETWKRIYVAVIKIDDKETADEIAARLTLIGFRAGQDRVFTLMRSLS